MLEGLGLRLNYEKTRIVHRDEGFTFLGWTFDREGKRPSEQALETLQLRLASASDGAERRQILAGWQGYFREARPVLAWAASSPAADDTKPLEDSNDLPWWADIEVEVKGAKERVGSGEGDGRSMADPASALERYRELFLGRPDVFGRFWQNGDRYGYAPIRRAPTDQELQDHLEGRAILGTYPLLPNGHTKALVLDIDGPDLTETGTGRSAAYQLSRQLTEELQQRGLRPLWVDTGGKGFHIWFCFSQPASAREVREWADRFLDDLRPFPPGVLVEVFPKQEALNPSALGALIRLPFGRHPQTGRWSRLLSEDGQPMSDEALWEALTRTSLLDPQALLAVGPTSVVPEPPGAIVPVVEGCALLSGLIKKAAQTHHLKHTERLALLYTLGQLGEAGQNYLHQVIALCSNYDPRTTERWIRRLEEGHRPIRCATLRGWLKDYLPGVDCSCNPDSHPNPKRAGPSPLDLLAKAPSSRARSRSQSSLEPPAAPSSVVEGNWDWDGVAEEIFGEALGDGPGPASPEPADHDQDRAG